MFNDRSVNWCVELKVFHLPKMVEKWLDMIKINELIGFAFSSFI